LAPELLKTIYFKDMKNNLPEHIAFIVDGNRRWAQKRNLPIAEGHKKAAFQRLEQIIYHSLKLGIPYITFWVFSTENWKRGKKFASLMFNILRIGLNRHIQKYINDGMRLNTIGDLSRLPKNLVSDIEKIKKKSRGNNKITVTMAINYGGRDEIIRAIKKINQKKPELFENITQEKLEHYLDTANMPDPDLIIRPGGEQRLSGFMLWQTAYAELYFTKTLFPDFGKKHLERALQEFKNRQRRFGK
jgi:undecaprenyl diphosphate synthase